MKSGITIVCVLLAWLGEPTVLAPQGAVQAAGRVHVIRHAGRHGGPQLPI